MARGGEGCGGQGNHGNHGDETSLLGLNPRRGCWTASNNDSSSGQCGDGFHWERGEGGLGGRKSDGV